MRTDVCSTTLSAQRSLWGRLNRAMVEGRSYRAVRARSRILEHFKWLTHEQL